jgi:GT2 family glycosyltransferase/glycosyltransferase involved in cell wall biosynthesis
MRLAFCMHTFAPVVGGSEALVAELARGLAQRGHQIAVFTSNASSTQAFVDPALPRLDAGEQSDRGTTIVRLPYITGPKLIRRLADRVMLQFHRRRWPGYGPVKVAWVGPHLLGLNRQLNKFAPELVTAAAYPFANLYAAQRWARSRRVPFVALPCLHPHDPWAFDNPWMEAELRRAEAVLALTPYERDYLLALGVEPARAHLLGMGIDPPAATVSSSPVELKRRLGLDPDLPLVLFLGRKEEGKGVSTLVAAGRALWDQGQRLALVLAGPETAWSRAQRPTLTKDLDPKRFCYLEQVEPALKEELLSHCDIVALPSQAESFGIVFLEGWARGKPVIGGRTGATCSLVSQGEDGLLVTPGDPAELAEALHTLLADRELAARFGEAGRRKALSHFSWERLGNHLEALYLNLAQAARGPSGLSKFPLPPGEGQGEGQHAKSPLPAAQAQRSRSPLPPGEGQGEGISSRPKISVLIVSHNGGPDLLRSVSSALEAGAEEVLVVDNASSDGTPAQIRRQFPQVRLLELSFNAGFAGGNNRGLRLAQGEFVVLLNQDASLEAGALGAFAEGFASHPRAGILAPRILVREEPRVLQSAGLQANQILYACDRGYLELDGPAWRKAGPVVGGSGAALAIRRNLLDQIGLFDPELFMYYEDLDLCLRAWLAGWEVLYLPEAVAYHRHRTQQRSQWHNEFLDHRNRLRLILKTFSGRSLLRRLLGEASFEARSLRDLIATRRWKAAELRILALLAAMLKMPSALRDRRSIQSRRRRPDQAIEELLESGWSYPREVPPTAALGPMRPAAERLDFSPAGNDAFSLGWYAPEHGENGWFRWTGSYGLAFLSGSTGATLLKLRAFSLVDQKLEIWWGSRCLGTISIPAGLWQEHRLSAAAGSQDARLLLVAEHTACPADLQLGADRRRLGVAFSELTLTSEPDR